jgi:hypothetical protein
MFILFIPYGVFLLFSPILKFSLFLIIVPFTVCTFPFSLSLGVNAQTYKLKHDAQVVLVSFVN